MEAWNEKKSQANLRVVEGLNKLQEIYGFERIKSRDEPMAYAINDDNK